MATVDEPANDFSTLPVVPEGVFTAPLKRPAHVGEDWLEPTQRDYSSDDDAIWNALFERQMDVLPGRACDAFFAGLQKLHLDRGGVPEFARLSEGLGALTGWSVWQSWWMASMWLVVAVAAASLPGAARQDLS